VRAIHPIRHALADRVELDAGADHVSVAGGLKLVVRYELGCEQLQLQRHRMTIIQAARSQTNEAFAGGFHRTCSERLLAVKVGQVIGVRFIDPVLPQFLQLFAQRIVIRLRPWIDAGADQIADTLVDDVEGIRVVAHCGSRTRTQIA
jgi:hypothetical protein